MTPEDKQELKELIELTSKAQFNDVIGRLNVLNANLVRIEGTINETKEHAKETNGRVAKNVKDIEYIRMQNLQHVINCPQTEEVSKVNNKISNLESRITKRETISNFLLKGVGIISMVAGLFYTITKILGQ